MKGFPVDPVASSGQLGIMLAWSSRWVSDQSGHICIGAVYPQTAALSEMDIPLIPVTHL